MEEKVIPVVDCPICGAKNVPLSYHGTFSRPGVQDIQVWECTSCGAVPNVVKDLEVKQWISVEELKEMGWNEDEPEEGK